MEKYFWRQLDDRIIVDLSGASASGDDPSQRRRQLETVR